MTLLGAPGANCASELCTMIDGEKQGLCFFFGGGSSWNYFPIRMRIICSGEVIIKLTRRQRMHMYISLQTYTYCVEGEWVEKNDGELTKETSDHPPLSLHQRWEAHQRPLLAGGVSPPGHLLPRLRSIALIVFLFIYFTIDFSVGADVALINSDWPVMV